MSALANSFCDGRDPRLRSRWKRGFYRDWCCLDARVATKGGDSIEQLQPMPNCCDAKLLQGLVRQARQNRLLYLVLAECRLILPEAQAPQPDHDVHFGAPTIGGGAHHLPGQRGCPGQIGLGVSPRFTKTVALK